MKAKELPYYQIRALCDCMSDCKHCPARESGIQQGYLLQGCKLGYPLADTDLRTKPDPDFVVPHEWLARMEKHRYGRSHD